MARRPLTDPVASLISDLSEAIAGSRPTWQDNVATTTEGLTTTIANAVTENVAPRLTSEIRRTVSASRSGSQSTNVTIDANGLQSGQQVIVSSDSRQERNSAEARRIVEDIAASGIAGGGMLPPNPPGDGPPEPPDDNEPDDFFRRMIELFQRFFGVRPDGSNNQVNTLLNNMTSILGGVRPHGPEQTRGAASNFMDTFADYFNVPRETEEATREAQENLRRSVDRLTEATNNAAGGQASGPPRGRFARLRAFFSRRTRRGGIATASRLASAMRPVLRGMANIIPHRWRAGAAQMGANVVGGIGQRFGIPAATAARFGAALGPAAIGVGILAYGIPLFGKGIQMAVSGLNKLADSALKTTFALADYSGVLAHANAQLEFNREMRKFDLAQRMAGFGADRLGQKNRLEQAMAPWEAAAGNAGNMWGTFIDSALATVVEMWNKTIAIGMDIHASILGLVPGDQGEANLRAAAEKLRNPQAPPQEQMWQGREAMFGQNAPDMVDFARRQQGPRRPVQVNGGN